MEIKNLQDAMKLQQDLTTKLNQRVEALRKDKAPSLDVLLKEKEKSIERLRADMELAKQERAVAVTRWDQRIEKRKAAVDTLESELTELKKQITDRTITEKGGGSKKAVRVGLDELTTSGATERSVPLNCECLG